MSDYDDYEDVSIRLYTPVFQRVIILVAVIIAVPVIMWTITTFVRSNFAKPKVPALEHIASTNPSPRIPAELAASPGPAPSAADQSAPQRGEGTSDAAGTGAGTKKAPPSLASLLDANQGAPIAPLSRAIAPPAANATGDASAANPASISVGSVPSSVPRPAQVPSQVPRSTDNAALTGAPSASDRGIAWPNPNATNPPDFAAPRLSAPPSAPTAPPPARAAAAEVLPAEEPIPGPVPLPRQRPGIFAVATTTTPSGGVPLPRARPVQAPADEAGIIECGDRGCSRQ